MIMIFWPIFLGWVGGGLVNYLADVLPRTRALSRHRCPDCEEEKPWLHLVWPAACAHCGQARLFQEWGILLGITLISTLLWFFPPADLGFYGGLVWTVYFALVVVVDFRHRLILHPVSIFGGLLGIGTGILLHGFWQTLLGGVVGFGLMLVFYFLGELFVRFLSRRRGEEIEEIALGFGDVNLSGVIGLLLGWPGVVAGILLAVLLGGMVSGVYLLVQLARKQYQAFQALPYGPFLIISAAVLIVYSRILS